MLSLLRVVAADEVELDRILSQNPYGTYRTASDIHVPVSFRNECAALSLLKHTCKSMLEAYPRSLAADKSAISSNTLSPFSNERTRAFMSNLRNLSSVTTSILPRLH